MFEWFPVSAIQRSEASSANDDVINDVALPIFISLCAVVVIFTLVLVKMRLRKRRENSGTTDGDDYNVSAASSRASSRASSVASSGAHGYGGSQQSVDPGDSDNVYTEIED